MINYLNQPAEAAGQIMIQPVTVPGAQATRSQEAMARQNGFRSYEEMILWHQAQRRGQQEANARASDGASPGAPRGMPQSWGEAWDYVRHILPSGTLGMVNEKVSAALGGGR